MAPNRCVAKLVGMIRPMIAEFFGTALLVYAASTTGQSTMIGALGSGFTLAFLIASLGKISGCHVNPAVSLGFLVAGLPDYPTALTNAILYIPCQLLGGITGAILCFLSTQGGWYSGSITGGRHIYHYDQTNAGSKEEAWFILGMQAIVLETIIGFQLIFVILMSGDHASTPLYCGFAVVVGILIGGDITGGSMNPARTFGPELVWWLFGAETPPAFLYHYVYWIGPITGGILAAVAYKVSRITGGILAAVAYKVVFGPREHRWRPFQGPDSSKSPIATDKYVELVQPTVVTLA